MIKILLPNRKNIEIKEAAQYPSGASQRYRKMRSGSEFARVLGGYLTEKVPDPLKFRKIKRISLLQRTETDRLHGIATRKLNRFDRRITKRLLLQRKKKPRWNYGYKITKR